MKTEQLKSIVVGLGVAVSLLLNVSASANQIDQIKAYKIILKAARSAEMPATAASLVEKAKVSEQESTAISVVRAAIAINPSAAPAVVGAIARVAPATAPVIAALAASLESKMAGAILLSAQSAAPAYAEKITVAINNALQQPPVATLIPGTPTSSSSANPERLRPMPPPFQIKPPFVPGGPNGVFNRAQLVVIQPGAGRIYSRP